MIIVCRQVDVVNYVMPDFVTGRECRFCKRPLQLGPVGQQRLQSNPDAMLVCNDCGFKIAAGIGLDKMDLEFSPQAVDEILNRGKRN